MDGFTRRPFLTLALRPSATFHDGSPVDAAAVAEILKPALSQWMGPAFEDVELIAATDEHRIEIRLRRPSQFLIEALEAPIRKQPGSVGTGPFQPSNAELTAFQANADYYLGRPSIDRSLSNDIQHSFSMG